MNKTEFIQLIQSPETLNAKQVAALKQVVADFPYFTASQVLLAKALFNDKHYEAEKYLKQTALAVPDREVLYNYLHDIRLEKQTIVPVDEKPVLEAVVEESVTKQDPAININRNTEITAEATVPEEDRLFVVEKMEFEPVVWISAPEDDVVKTPVVEAPLINEAIEITQQAIEIIEDDIKVEEPIAIEEPVVAIEPNNEAHPVMETVEGPDTEDVTVDGELVEAEEAEIEQTEAINEEEVLFTEKDKLPTSNSELPINHSPLPNETHSFMEWLQLASNQPITDQPITDQPITDQPITTSPTPEPETSNSELRASPPEVPVPPTREQIEEAVAKSNINDFGNILDKFIKENPSISRPKAEFFNPVNMAKQSVEEDDELVTETLANLLYKQGNLKKAIRAYEKLCLLYPSKMTYFATLIQKIKTELKD